ncbi:MAG TPA: DUF4912 domain-containing protein [Nitrospirota bacterium]
MEALDKEELLRLARRHGLAVEEGVEIDALIDALMTIEADEEHSDAGVGESRHPESPRKTRKTAGKKPKPAARTVPEPPHEPEHLQQPEEEPGFQQVVEESKYYTGQPFEAIYGLPSELPASYGDDEITLLVRDPHWGFAFWEVTQQKLDDMRASLGEDGRDAHLALRLYDITGINFNGFNANTHYDTGIFERVGNWYLNTGNPGGTFVTDVGLKTPNGVFITLARSNAIDMPRDTVSEVLDEEWLLPEEIAQRIFALSGGTAGGPLASGTLSSAGLPKRGVTERLEQLGGIASPGISSLALMSPSMPNKERAFWFVLNAELIVYGATEPDAKVSLCGLPVELRPDGTFSMRFSLPDGTVTLPFAATSADGEESRAITTQVSRNTESN